MRYRAADNVAYEVLDGEAVLLDLDSSRYYSLNRSGARAWQVLADGAGADEASAAVVERFDVAADVASADVSELIDRLLAAGLLVASS